tara:strand:+ start:96 stop:533 length:438 start_codon:yes stop_codon:yes gene_type:complete
MTKIRKYIILTCAFLTFTSFAIGKDSFFDDALKMYKEKKYDDAKFLFERNIVYNPKSADSYLYLAKIYNKKDDKKKEQQNLNTVLLIEPSNEEAILMIMKISLEKSNYSKVQKLSETFAKVCKNLCDENDKIKESLKNIESKNES